MTFKPKLIRGNVGSNNETLTMKTLGSEATKIITQRLYMTKSIIPSIAEDDEILLEKEAHSRTSATEFFPSSWVTFERKVVKWFSEIAFLVDAKWNKIKTTNSQHMTGRGWLTFEVEVRGVTTKQGKKSHFVAIYYVIHFIIYEFY